MAVFTSRFIDSLADPYERQMAKVFNDISLNDKDIKPQGLFGCLFSVHNVLLSGRSQAFQEALFRGAVKPLFSLIEDLEKYGDLNEHSIGKLHLANQELGGAIQRYRRNAPKSKEEALKYFDDVMKDSYPVKQIIEQKEQKEKALRYLATAEQEFEKYKQNENFDAEKEKKLIKEIDKFKKEIEDIDYQIEFINDVQIKPFREEYTSALDSEFDAIEAYFKDLREELAYMEGCVKAIKRKDEIDKEYPLNGNKKQKKKRMEALSELREEFQYGISDFIDDAEFVKEHGGNLLIPLSQGKLAAMGHSDGLCAGFAAEFLSICASESEWNNLSPSSKLKKLHPIIQGAQMFTFSSPFDQSHNKLFLSIQTGIFFKRQMQGKMKTHNCVLIDRANCRNDDGEFYGKIIKKLMEDLDRHDFNKGALNYFVSLSGKDQGGGHAFALSCSKDGTFLFQDSNIGYILFYDKELFSKFLVNHFKRYYPDLNDSCAFFDFKLMKEAYDNSQYPEFEKLYELKDKLEQESNLLPFPPGLEREEPSSSSYQPSHGKPQASPVLFSKPPPLAPEEELTQKIANAKTVQEVVDAILQCEIEITTRAGETINKKDLAVAMLKYDKGEKEFLRYITSSYNIRNKIMEIKGKNQPRKEGLR